MPYDDDDGERPSKPAKAGRSGRPNGTAREVDRLLPKQGTVYIRHRREDGTVEYCGHYSIMDVAPDGAIEPFLFEHLAPQWGGGEYLVYLKPTAERPRVTVRIAEPPQRASGHAGPGPGPGAPQHSPARLFREAMQVVEDIKQSSARGEGGGAASFDIALRLGRLEAKLESVFGGGGPGAAYGGPGPYGFADAGAHPHAPPWSPASPVPLPGPEASAERSVLDIVLEDRRYYRDRLELEREKLDREREKLELERQRQSGVQGNPLQSVQETLSSAKSLATAAHELVNATAGNDNNGKSASPVQSFVDSFAGAMGKEVTHRMGDWFASTSARRPSPPGADGRGGGNRPKKRRGKKSVHRARPSQGREGQGAQQVPVQVPSYFREPADSLDQAADRGPDEAVVVALVQALASLRMSSEWRPFVDDTCMRLVQDDHEGTLQRLGALLGALVRGGHLRERSAHRVLSIADERWDETREQLLVLFQQHQAQARASG